jgi:hypothetical protein
MMIYWMIYWIGFVRFVWHTHTQVAGTSKPVLSVVSFRCLCLGATCLGATVLVCLQICSLACCWGGDAKDGARTENKAFVL